MHLVLNLVSRLLPFPKGKLFFILRFIFFQWNVFLFPSIVLFFVLLYERVGLKIQCIFLLSSYIFCNFSQKHASGDTLSTAFKLFILFTSFILIFSLVCT